MFERAAGAGEFPREARQGATGVLGVAVGAAEVPGHHLANPVLVGRVAEVAEQRLACVRERRREARRRHVVLGGKVRVETAVAEPGASHDALHRGAAHAVPPQGRRRLGDDSLVRPLLMAGAVAHYMLYIILPMA